MRCSICLFLIYQPTSHLDALNLSECNRRVQPFFLLTDPIRLQFRGAQRCQPNLTRIVQEERRREKEKERMRFRLNRKRDSSRRRMRVELQEQGRVGDADATQSDSGGEAADVIDVTTPGNLSTALLYTVLCIIQSLFMVCIPSHCTPTNPSHPILSYPVSSHPIPQLARRFSLKIFRLLWPHLTNRYRPHIRMHRVPYIRK